jgi:hypothetical protein
LEQCSAVAGGPAARIFRWLFETAPTGAYVFFQLAALVLEFLVHVLFLLVDGLLHVLGFLQ